MSRILPEKRVEYLNQIVVPVVRNLLTTCPLEAPVPHDRNTHPTNPSASQKHGTVLLPLWRQNSHTNESSPHWKSYTSLIQMLSPAFDEMAAGFKYADPELEDLYDKAIRIYLQEATAQNEYKLVPPEPMQIWNCFQTMRLSANLALESAPLDAGDGSRWAMMMGFGNANPEVLPPGFAVEFREMTSGVELCVGPGFKVETKAYKGEWYSLELFLPKIEGEGGVDSEALNFMEVVWRESSAEDEQSRLNYGEVLAKIRNARDESQVKEFLGALSKPAGARDGEVYGGIVRWWNAMVKAKVAQDQSTDHSGQQGDGRVKKSR